jgi:hypothetical protein
MSFWDVPPDQVFPEFFNQELARVEQAIFQLCQRYVVEIETWMKANAKWQDRTGNLRQSLYAQVEQFTREIVLSFDYGLEYGFWLEFANQGRYAIIAPALDEFAPKIIADIQRLLQ